MKPIKKTHPSLKVLMHDSLTGDVYESDGVNDDYISCEDVQKHTVDKQVLLNKLNELVECNKGKSFRIEAVRASLILHLGLGDIDNEE